jgi:hypothetical protein
MNVTEVEISELRVTRQFENRRVCVRVSLQDGDSVEEACQLAQRHVDQEFDRAKSDKIQETHNRVLAALDGMTQEQLERVARQLEGR